MSSILVTGATGLLGTYLLRDLLSQGESVAVLVRPTRIRSGRERLEQLFKVWPEYSGLLNSVKVLEGDITKPLLGLSREDVRYASLHCNRMLHSAASLKFREANGEPWNSNFQGTKNVVEFCETVGVSSLHYVSTAYVCGRTEVPALELPVPHDVSSRNVYEESKCAAERVVLDSDLESPPTILRPSIIIGDSQSGYTTTFHGVYTPVRLAIAAATGGFGRAAPPPGVGPRTVLNAGNILKMMGLSGNEQKNLVPVDWVSQVMCDVVRNPEHHGSIYHVAATNPTPIDILVRATVESVHEALQLPIPSSDAESHDDNSAFDQAFCTQLSMYQAYWDTDPVFDVTNLSLATGRSCPAVTLNSLRHTFLYAARSAAS